MSNTQTITITTTMDTFTCPITQSLFKKGCIVMAMDGIMYNEDAFVAWTEKSGNSPLTGVPLKSTSYTKCYLLNTLYETALITNETLAAQYKEDHFGVSDSPTSTLMYTNKYYEEKDKLTKKIQQMKEKINDLKTQLTTAEKQLVQLIEEYTTLSVTKELGGFNNEQNESPLRSVLVSLEREIKKTHKIHVDDIQHSDYYQIRGTLDEEIKKLRQQLVSFRSTRVMADHYKLYNILAKIVKSDILKSSKIPTFCEMHDTMRESMEEMRIRQEIDILNTKLQDLRHGKTYSFTKYSELYNNIYKVLIKLPIEHGAALAKEIGLE